MKLRALLSLALGCVLLGLGFYRSHQLFEKNGAVDFRNRVVAARVANQGLDPYFFKWSPEYSEKLYDPSDEANLVYSRLTSPPTTLTLHRAFASLPWKTQKTLNFYLSWIALLSIAGIAFRKSKRDLQILGIVVVITGIYAISGTWQFHTERGQQYIYLAFFLTLAWASSGKMSGVWMSLSPFFRPTLGLSAFLSFRRDQGLRSFLTAVFTGVFLAVPVLFLTPLAWWKSYASSAHDWYLHAYGMHARLEPAFVKVFTPLSSADGDSFLSAVTSFGAWGNPIYRFTERAFGSAPPYWAGMSTTFALVLFSGITLWRAREETLTRFGLRFFSAVYLIDLFLPSPRGGYNSVLFFPGLLLAALVYAETQNRNEKLRLAPLGMGALFSLNSLWHPLSSSLLTECAFTIGAALALFQGTRKPTGSAYTSKDNRVDTVST